MKDTVQITQGVLAWGFHTADGKVKYLLFWMYCTCAWFRTFKPQKPFSVTPLPVMGRTFYIPYGQIYQGISYNFQHTFCKNRIIHEIIQSEMGMVSNYNDVCNVTVVVEKSVYCKSIWDSGSKLIPSYTGHHRSINIKTSFTSIFHVPRCETNLFILEIVCIAYMVNFFWGV